MSHKFTLNWIWFLTFVPANQPNCSPWSFRSLAAFKVISMFSGLRYVLNILTFFQWCLYLASIIKFLIFIFVIFLIWSSTPLLLEAISSCLMLCLIFIKCFIIFIIFTLGGGQDWSSLHFFFSSKTWSKMAQYCTLKALFIYFFWIFVTLSAK